jgi:hypothetical protein
MLSSGRLAALVADPVADAQVVDAMEVEAAHHAVVEAYPDAIDLVVALVAVLGRRCGGRTADDARAGGQRPARAEPNWLPTTPPITAPRIAPAPDGRDATETTSMLVTWPYSPYTGAEAIGASTTRSVYTGVDEHALIRASAPTRRRREEDCAKDMIGSPGEQRGPRVAGPRQTSRAS